MKTLKGKLTLLLLVIATLLSLPGCWDTQDLRKNAFITAIGIDTVAGVTPTNKIPLRYKVSAEIIKPAFLKTSGSLGATGQKTSIVLTAEGATIEQAFDTLQARLSRPISLAHLSILLVGEKMARKNFKDIGSFFEKHPEVARRVRLMFVKDAEALDILKTTPKLEEYLAQELVAMTELKEDFSLAPTISFTDFLRELRTNNGQTLAARVLIAPNGTIIHHGSAVFADWRLVGWLDSNETRKANLLREPKKTTILQSEQGIYTYLLDNKSVQISPLTKDGQLKFKVKLKTDGILLQEEKGDLDLTKPKNIAKIEKKFTQVITREIREAILKSQKDFGVDYFYFGMKLMNKQPELYHNLNWQKTFPNIPIEIEVKTKISRFGLAK